MMEPTASPFEWRAALLSTYEDVLRQLIEIAPQIVGAVVLVLLGWVIASLLSLISRKGMGGVDTVIRRFTKTADQRQGIPQQSYAVLVSKVVFWSVLLFFVAAASNLLGWQLFAGWMDSLIRHLPNLIMGLLIILAGFVAAGSVHNAAHRLSARAGVANANIFALSTQAVVILTTVIIGVEQMGINVGFLTTLIAVIAGILLAGACLAFGLGAQGLVANILGAQFARKHYRVGEVLNVAGMEGGILEITQTSVVLETKNGRSVVPAHLLQREAATVESDAAR